jgi:hypothetical protein
MYSVLELERLVCGGGGRERERDTHTQTHVVAQNTRGAAAAGRPGYFGARCNLTNKPTD